MSKTARTPGGSVTQSSALTPHHLFADVISDLLSRRYRVRFRAKGKSMYPTIKEGEVITVEPVEPSDVKLGDIILYRFDKGVIAHRVVQVKWADVETGNRSFILRGDASACCDVPVEAQQIVGHVVAVERASRRIALDSRRAKMLRTARVCLSQLKRWIVSVQRNTTRSVRPLRWIRIFLALLFIFTVPDGTVEAGVNDIAVDSTSSTASSGKVSSLTWSHTVRSGSNQILVVGISLRKNNKQVNSITYGGAALTFLNAQIGGGPDHRVEIWYQIAPATGTATIAVTLSNTVEVVGGAVSFTGVHQSTPFGTFVGAQGRNTTPSVTVSSATREAVIDVLSASGDSGTVSVGAGQTEQWNASSGTKDANEVGAGSTQPGAASVTMLWSLTNSNKWAIGAVPLKPAVTPTAVDLTAFTATGYDRGILLQWRTGYEVDNLGFHLYREAGGQRVRVTPSLVAGSALLAGPGTPLTAGRSYAWWDKGIADCGLRIADCQNAQYWLEDVDLNGQSTWHGPVEIEPSAVSDQPSALEQEQAVLLSQLGSNQSQIISHHPSARNSAQSAIRHPPSAIRTQWALAAQPAVKLSIREEGWYRVGQPELVAAGLDPRVDPRWLQLFVDGQEQPIVVMGEQDGRFDPGDDIEFYGVGLDTPWTDTRIYWLVVGSQPGKRITVVPGSGQRARTQSFRFTAERKERMIYFAALKNGEAENFFGPVVTREPVEQTLRLHHLDPAPSRVALLEVALQGVTNVLHRVMIQFNDRGWIVRFDGQVRYVATVWVSQTWLREGENRVTLLAIGRETDVSLLDSIRLTYWHITTADNDALRLTVPGNQPVIIDGFRSPRIRVVDITDPAAVQQVAGEVQPRNAGFAVMVQVPAPRPRTLLAFIEDQMKRPAMIRAHPPSTWRLAEQGADLVIITHRTLLESVAPLKALREEQGWVVEVVDVEDLYDEFSFGHKTPWALRDFLETARRQWRRPPRFVLLVGDSSLDPRNYVGFGEADLVPTKLVDTAFMETASDDWFTDFDEDGLPEMAVGRLPVRTAEEATTVVSKIVAYEQAGGDWRRHVLLVADKNDRGNEAAFNFEAASASVQFEIPNLMTVERFFLSRKDPLTAKSELVESLNQGQLIVNYIGHGSVGVWRGDLLTSVEARALTNGERLPFFVNMTCLNGFFHDPYTESLAEALIKADHGGAVAVWASSGLTDFEGQAVIAQKLFRLIFSRSILGRTLTLGEATVGAKAAVSDRDIRDIRRTWILFGDPTMRLK